MIFADYTRLVLADFEKKKAAGLLPAELLKPSPGELRDLCYRMCVRPYNRKDEQALEPIFGTAADQKARLKSIEDFKITQFKPLINFLNKPTIQPKLKTIELLAWLIDFKGRPYDLYGRPPIEEPDYAANIEVSVRLDDAQPPEDAADEPEGGSETGLDPLKSGASRNKKIKIIVTISIVLAASIGFFSMWERRNSQVGMFWADDHYQVVLHNQELGKGLVVPLDSGKLMHFRKITREDTITENALGSIWCVRYHGKYECYTDTGRHPIDTSLKLEKLTDYILMRYVNPKIGALKVSQ